MRIAHVVSTFPPYKGGMGNVAAALVERTRARGYDVRVVTPATVRPWVRFGNASWCPGIRGALEAMQPDVVHLHWPFIGGAGAVVRWRLADKRRRLVVQYHMDLIGSGWRGAAFAAYQHRALPSLVRAADRVVCSSRDYAEHGALASCLSFLGERFAEIPLGVDVRRFAPKSQISNLKSQITVLFVGGLDRAHAFKGLPVLLEAVVRVPEVRLSIVGDGDLRAKYEQQARALGMGDRVTFFGALPDAALPDAYRAADVLVLPSTARSEAFGLVLLEAMACGIPVIASDLPGVRTVVRNGETGWLVPPGDAAALADRLAWVAAHHDTARAMGGAGRNMVERYYNGDRIADQWCNLYHEL